MKEYTEARRYSGELFAVYDNFGNMTDLRDNPVKVVLIVPKMLSS